MLLERSYILFGLLLIPLLAALFVLYKRRKRKALEQVGDLETITSLMPDYSPSALGWKFFLLLTGLTLMLIAAAGPRIGSKLKEVETKGREIIVALDVSNSMLAEDVAPSRLIRAKQQISRLVDKMKNDKLGLVVFAGDAYVQIPVTDDYASIKMFLETIGPEMVSKQGTAIGAAIDLASKSFATSEEQAEQDEAPKNRAIVVITDGENHEDDAVEATRRAKEKGIRVYTVGLGDPNGVPIPVSAGSSEKRRDRNGDVVVSKLNEKLLIDIAREGNGAYIPVDKISSLPEELEALEKDEIKTRTFSEYAERFQYFAGVALFFLILEILVMSRKNPLIKSLNLFNQKS
ncbi:MAG: VWA domain-containing protein [Bacteroidota bacterium]